MLSGLGAVGSTVAIVVAAVLGKNALADYKNQKLIDREIEAAESTLAAAYKAFDAVAHMRGRWIPGHETEAAEQALRDAGAPIDSMDEMQKKAHVTRGVIYRRAEYFKEDFDAIFRCIPLAKVYFGQTVVNWLKEFPKARNRMLGSADFLPMIGDFSDSQADKDFVAQVRQDIFGSPDDKPDEIRDSVATAMAHLEATLISKLRAEKGANV